jgi:hypothetical protein
MLAYAWRVWRLYKRVKREQDAASTPYMDEAMRPLFEPVQPQGAAGDTEPPSDFDGDAELDAAPPPKAIRAPRTSSHAGLP